MTLLDETLDWLRDPFDLHRRARRGGAVGTPPRGPPSASIEPAARPEPIPTPSGAPLVVGDLRSARKDARTVMIYGHYDVQDPGDLDAWESPPFEPTIRDGRIYARGATDDKGNFFPLLHTACALAAAGDLPVNVRVLIEGAEEASRVSTRWVRSCSSLRYRPSSLPCQVPLRRRSPNSPRIVSIVPYEPLRFRISSVRAGTI